MIKEIDITIDKFAKEVFSIQIISYQVEAELIGYSDIPPLKDTVGLLQRSGETFYGYYLNGELCGAISFKADNQVIDIHRLMVHPDYFRKGIAKKLLEFVENNKGNNKTIIVTTGSKNLPAVNLYLKNGFSNLGEKKVASSIFLTHFKKEL